MILDYNFFNRDVLEVAPDLVGKLIVRNINGEIIKLRISEVEAYRGEDDTACHAHKGKTKRTKVMYGEAGRYYIYLCYGIHYLLNIVTGNINEPQAVLIRATLEANGPGKLTKMLKIDNTLNDKKAEKENRLWIEDDGYKCKYTCDKRIGIAYATKEDQDKLWRYILEK